MLNKSISLILLSCLIFSNITYGAIGWTYDAFVHKYGKAFQINHSDKDVPIPYSSRFKKEKYLSRAKFKATYNDEVFIYYAWFDTKSVCYYLTISKEGSLFTNDNVQTIVNGFKLDQNKTISKEDGKLYYEWVGFTNYGADVWKYKTLYKYIKCHWNDNIGMMYLPQKMETIELWLIKHDNHIISKFNKLIL